MHVSPRGFRSARSEPFVGFCFFRTRPNRSRSRPPRRFSRAARKRPAASNADATRSRARPTRRRGASGALSIFPRRREYTRARSVRSVPGTITRRRRSSSSRPSSRDSRRFTRSRGSPDAAEARVGALLLFCSHARASLPWRRLRARRSREAIQKPKKKRAVDRSRRARCRFPAYAKDYSASLARPRVSQQASASEKAQHARHAERHFSTRLRASRVLARFPVALFLRRTRTQSRSRFVPPRERSRSSSGARTGGPRMRVCVRPTLSSEARRRRARALSVGRSLKRGSRTRRRRGRAKRNRA